MRRRQRAKEETPRRRKNGLGLFGWLALGAAGAGALAWWTNRRPAATRPPAEPDPPPPRPPLGELPDDVEIAWVPGPGGTLRVAQRHPGAELAIVFVHGLAGRLELWSDQLAGLGPGLRGIAFDLPGHGDSDRTGDYAIPRLAGSVAAVLDAFRIRRAVLVAHSMGAAVAIDYAGSHPDRVAGLLLVDPAGDQTKLSLAERETFLEPLRRDPGAESEWYFRQLLAGARPEVVELVLRSLEDTPEEAFLGCLEAVTRYSPLKALERYAGPMRAVLSELNSTPISLHRLVPGLSVVRLTGVSHWLMLDEPDAVLEALWDFLEDVV